MPDREKVVRHIKAAIEIAKLCKKDFASVDIDMLSDAYELLKEQDPVETELEGGGHSWWYVCGECHGAIDQNDNYCKHCGRRIKHEKKAE